MLTRGGSLFLLGFVLAGCKPSVGSRCDKGEARCVDATSALVCQDGRYIETPCRGKAGCRLAVDRTACDVHGDRPGDACSTDEEGAGVCIDAKSLLACRKGKYVSLACRGAHGCAEEGQHAECDATVAESAESCAAEGKKACSADGKRVLQCAQGQMETRYQCRGERACVVTQGKIDCDVSIARSGDACDVQFEGTYACTEDALAIVRCVNGRFGPDETCKHGMRCFAEPGTTRCAKPEKS